MFVIKIERVSLKIKLSNFKSINSLFACYLSVQFRSFRLHHDPMNEEEKAMLVKMKISVSKIFKQARRRRH